MTDDRAFRAAGAVASATALLALENKARSTSSAQVKQQLAAIFAVTAAQYVQMFGSLSAPADPQRARVLQQRMADDLLALEGRDYSQFLTKFAVQALDLGIGHAVVKVPQELGPVDVSGIDLPQAAVQVIQEVSEQVEDRIEQARRLVLSVRVQTFADLQPPMAKAYTAAVPVDAAAATAVNSASNGGIAAVAGRTGGKLLWIAEPDACLVCLALSGHLADPATGEMFDEDATFGKPGSAPAIWPYGMPLTGPPRHRWCRCRLEIWYGAVTPPGGPLDSALYGGATAMGGGVDLPAALRREAKRSVLRGWSLPTESGKARIEAADRLLARGSGMPKSVDRFARDAVRNGRYEDRSVPFKTAKRPK